MMRTEIDAVEDATVLRQQRFEPSENMVQALESDEPSCDLRAVGDSDGKKSRILRSADGAAGARNQRNVIGAYHTGIAWLLVEDAVAVEKNGGALVADI